jgi:hypothetical protein
VESEKSTAHVNKTKLLYHGGERELRLESIKFPGLRNDCDFGAGFYCAENKDTADEWVAKKSFLQTMGKDLRTLRNSVFEDGKFYEDYLEKVGESYAF